MYVFKTYNDMFMIELTWFAAVKQFVHPFLRMILFSI